MKNLLLKLVGVVGLWAWPLSQKKFVISDHLALTSYFEEHKIKFALVLVSTDGAFSNFLIRLSYLFGGQKHKFSKFTHIGAYVGDFYYEHTMVEAIGQGVVTRTLVEAICNRDNVKVLIPSSKINRKIAENARQNAIAISKRDALDPISYDYSHNPNDSASYDCSELVFSSIRDGFNQADQICPLHTVVRLGQETIAPIDLEFSDLFEVIYDSKKGFLDGKVH